MAATNNSSLPISTSSLSQEVQVRMGKTGLSAEAPITVMQNFDQIVHKHGDAPALHQKVNGQWKTWTFKEYRAQVDAFAKSLLKLGFERFDTINIIGFNSPEWFFANFGAVAAGGVGAGIYATNGPEACQYIAAHSKAKVIVVEGVKQLEKFYAISKDLPNLQALVMYGPDKVPADVKSQTSVPVYSFASFLKIGKEVSATALAACSNSWKPGETVALIYTSGTTGPPKAVMITNDNITFTVKSMITRTKHGSISRNDSMISYLPLSHIAAQMLDMHLNLATGCQIYFAQPDALKGSLKTTLQEVRPTVFFGVPRVWEKFYDALQEIGKKTTGFKKTLSTWAKAQAAAHWASVEYGSKTSSPFWYFLAKKILHKAHVAMGLDRCENLFVSAAPIEAKILRYFCSIDLPVLELFGQSECTGPHTVNCLKAFKIGSVGRPLEGTETKCDEGTGELCYRGRHIFAGYMGMEDKTKETIDPEGWLHSGDVVSIDSDNHPKIPAPSGFVTITGRIKELIITAGGENIPPVLIENEIKEAMPAISNAMVIGDKRKFLTVLLSLAVEVDDEGVPNNKLTGKALEAGALIGSSAKTTEEAAKDPKWQKYIEDGLAAANKKATSRAQKVGKWTLLPTDFSEKGTELTPTLKLKRSVAADKYSDLIEAMYG